LDVVVKVCFGNGYAEETLPDHKKEVDIMKRLRHTQSNHWLITPLPKPLDIGLMADRSLAVVRLENTSLMEFHHGLIKHYNLNVVVKYELIGFTCGLQGIEMVYNQDVDSSLHFAQWDPRG